MAVTGGSIGIVGGTGMLGSAILGALLGSKAFEHANFWVSNRSGAAPEFEHGSGIHVTKDNQELADGCDIIILCVPPAHFADIDHIDEWERDGGVTDQRNGKPRCGTHNPLKTATGLRTVRTRHGTTVDLRADGTPMAPVGRRVDLDPALGALGHDLERLGPAAHQPHAHELESHPLHDGSDDPGDAAVDGGFGDEVGHGVQKRKDGRAARRFFPVEPRGWKPKRRC